jgi:uncharacterized phiE125 gp8 family phage protein
MPIVLITPPAVEPVTLADLKSQLGLSPVQDTDHVQSVLISTRLRRLIAVARAECENITRRVFVTQTWKLLLDSWPYRDNRYSEHWYRSIVLPKPPFQSVSTFTYTDTQGIAQDMFVYGFQVDPGSETQSARLTSPFAQPWPPIRMIPNNVKVQFRCGYGGPVMVTTSANSAVLTAAVWNAGDVGLAISIPGAGASGATLVTSIAAVDVNGQATLAVAATTAVTNAVAFAGQPVPTPITQAILFLAQFYEENGAVTDLPVPRVVRNLLGPYCNYVS